VDGLARLLLLLLLPVCAESEPVCISIGAELLPPSTATPLPAGIATSELAGVGCPDVTVTAC
jgi:hypothetical protein